MCIKINPLLFAPRLAAEAVAFCWHLLSDFYNPSWGLYLHPCHLAVIHSLTLSHWPKQGSQQMDSPLYKFHLLTVSSLATSPQPRIYEYWNAFDRGVAGSQWSALKSHLKENGLNSSCWEHWKGTALWEKFIAMSPLMQILLLTVMWHLIDLYRAIRTVFNSVYESGRLTPSIFSLYFTLYFHDGYLWTQTTWKICLMVWINRLWRSGRLWQWKKTFTVV